MEIGSATANPRPKDLIHADRKTDENPTLNIVRKKDMKNDMNRATTQLKVRAKCLRLIDGIQTASC